MEFGRSRKRGRKENSNGGSFKKSRPESDSSQPGVGSKLKPCTKFFSTSGCPFGAGCHFLHHVPGGYIAASQMMNQPAPFPSLFRNSAGSPPFLDASCTPAWKTKMCNKFNTPEGCKFGDKCHFSHGGLEFGRPSIASQDDPRGMRPLSGRGGGRMNPPPPGLAGDADFGTKATAKISIDASLTGAVIGKGGVNSKQINRVTGVRLAIRDHESDPNLRNVELEGPFDQLEQATAMVREFMANVKGATMPPEKHSMAPGGGSNHKTKLCEKFSKGCCTFGDRCHFAHGAEELRENAM